MIRLYLDGDKSWEEIENAADQAAIEVLHQDEIDRTEREIARFDALLKAAA